MLNYKGICFAAAVAVSLCPSLPAQDAAKKELTARELFYTAVSAPAKPPSVESKPEVKTAVKPPAKKQVQVARSDRKPPAAKPLDSSSGPVVSAQSGNPPAGAAAPDGTPVIAATVRKTAPAPTAGPSLGLRYTITKLVDGKMVEVAPDSVFKAGDRIRITVVPNTSGYLYIINQGSSGTWKPLFPSADVDDGNNRVEGFRDYVLPPKSRIVFDEQAGTERLFVVLSREPEPDLENMIYSLQGGPKSTTPAGETAPPAKEQPKLLLAANISNETVGRMRQVYARDLVIEKVDEDTPGDRREKAVYVVNPSGSAESRVVADIALAHQ